MEPLEVLRDMIRDGGYPSIGGPPQMVKVYRYMHCKEFGIYWPNRQTGTRTVLGRPLLDFETANCQVLDPDALDTHQDHAAPATADTQNAPTAF